MTLTSLKYLTVVSKNNFRKLQGPMHYTYSPRVFGKVFSNSLAKSGSFKRAFISEITFYQPHSRKSIQSEFGEPQLTILTSTDELLNVRHAGAGRIKGNFSAPAETLPCGDYDTISTRGTYPQRKHPHL